MIATADRSAASAETCSIGRSTGERFPGNTVDEAFRAWAGLCNTHFWVDRATGVTGAIYSQTLPFVAPEVYQVHLDFETALYSTL